MKEDFDIFRDKRILITGGTGSFGNALVDRLLELRTRQIIIFSRDEKKQQDMSIKYSGKNLLFIIGDIRDRRKLEKSFKNIDYIFHAAALKHVPIGELYPEEVIKTNIIGTKNVIEAAELCGVRKVVNFSSDKAVYPVNAYGMSKALAEKLVCAHGGNTECINLRYGNVLGSRGSVIPIFLNQIRNNQPLTITNPRMTRFLLLLRNAVSLSLICVSEGRPGDLYVIRSPACTIETLVNVIKKLFDKFRGDGEILVKEIGIRPGEKIHETLLTEEEVSRSNSGGRFGIEFTRVFSVDRNSCGDFSNTEPFTSENAERFYENETLKILLEAKIL